jgi:hypothetical protein
MVPKVCANTLDPVWDKDFDIEIPERGGLLKLVAFDKDDLGKDDFLGEFKVRHAIAASSNHVPSARVEFHPSPKPITRGRLCLRSSTSAATAPAPPSSTRTRRRAST